MESRLISRMKIHLICGVARGLTGQCICKWAYLFGFGMYFSIGIRGVVAVFLKYYQIGARGEVGKIWVIFI